MFSSIAFTLRTVKRCTATHTTAIPWPTVITHHRRTRHSWHRYSLHTVPRNTYLYQIYQFPSGCISKHTYIPASSQYSHRTSTQNLNTEHQHRTSIPILAPTEVQQKYSTSYTCLAKRSTQRVLNTYLCPFILHQTQISPMLPLKAAPVNPRPILAHRQGNPW